MVIDRRPLVPFGIFLPWRGNTGWKSREAPYAYRIFKIKYFRRHVPRMKMKKKEIHRINNLANVNALLNSWRAPVTSRTWHRERQNRPINRDSRLLRIIIHIHLRTRRVCSRTRKISLLYKSPLISRSRRRKPETITFMPIDIVPYRRSYYNRIRVNIDVRQLKKNSTSRAHLERSRLASGIPWNS